MNTIKLNGVTIEIGAASIHIEQVEVDAIDLIATIASFQGEEDQDKPFPFTPLFDLDKIMKDGEAKAKEFNKNNDFPKWTSAIPGFKPFGDESLGDKGKAFPGTSELIDVVDFLSKGAPLFKSFKPKDGSTFPLGDLLSVITDIQQKGKK